MSQTVQQILSFGAKKRKNVCDVLLFLAASTKYCLSDTGILQHSNANSFENDVNLNANDIF